MWKRVDAFNQEKALVGAFSVIIQLRRLIVYSTTQARALAEHRRRLDTAARSRRMEQQIVRRIEARNPAIGQHLANNMKDYIVFRFKEDFNWADQLLSTSYFYRYIFLLFMVPLYVFMMSVSVAYLYFVDILCILYWILQFKYPFRYLFWMWSTCIDDGGCASSRAVNEPSRSFKHLFSKIISNRQL